MTPIYLDHNATTPLEPEVAEAMARCQAQRLGNPASQHAAGRRARQVLEKAREEIGRVLGAETSTSQADRVVFTSGGTEANNLALFGLAGETEGHAVISAIEHPSVAGPAEQLQRQGWHIDRLPVNADGVVQLDRLAELLRPNTRFVSVMLGNNETGVLEPVGQVAERCAARGIPLHTDAVQVAGKLPVSFRELGVAAMSVSAHKLHGPVGVGALLVRAGVELRPRLWGGFQQEGLRPGTESVALAVGMHAALALWQRDRDEHIARLGSLRDRFEAELLADCPELVVHGARAQRLPQTSSIGFPGVEGQALLIAMDLAGVACSTGSACASGSVEASPTLVAMGVEKSLAAGSLRFSFGLRTTADEASQAVRRILQIYKELRRSNLSRKTAVTGRQSVSKTL